MDKVISLRLPIPPSANAYWRHDRGATHLSADAYAYRDAVGWECRELQIEMFDASQKLALKADFYGLRAARDLGNCEKQLSDALQGFCFPDDNQIASISLRRHYVPKVKVKDGYVLVEIQEDRTAMLELERTKSE